MSAQVLESSFEGMFITINKQTHSKAFQTNLA